MRLALTLAAALLCATTAASLNLPTETTTGAAPFDDIGAPSELPARRLQIRRSSSSVRKQGARDRVEAKPQAAGLLSYFATLTHWH